MFLEKIPSSPISGRRKRNGERCILRRIFYVDLICIGVESGPKDE
jgi:hypothetical protein